MKTIRIHFEDHGQDFAWWDVKVYSSSQGIVVDCGPFQASVWVGYWILSPMNPGCKILISKSPESPVRRLKYPIRKVLDKTPSDQV